MNGPKLVETIIFNGYALSIILLDIKCSVPWCVVHVHVCVCARARMLGEGSFVVRVSPALNPIPTFVKVSLSQLRGT